MGVLEIAFVAIVQGLTEFLPISSSAHIVLASHIFDGNVHAVGVDIVLHAGTLLAVVIYFAKEIKTQVRGLFLPTAYETREYTNSLILGTIPIVVIGALTYQGIDILRTPSVIAAALIISGLALIIADYAARRGLVDTRLSLRKKGFSIGVFQALALIPGVSRSGITIAAGRSLGFSRKEATKFSFFLSIPTIAAALMLAIIENARSAEVSQTLFSMEMAVGFAVSFFVAYVTIHFFLRLVNKMSFAPFFMYQVLLGVLVLLLV